MSGKIFWWPTVDELARATLIALAIVILAFLVFAAGRFWEARYQISVSDELATTYYLRDIVAGQLQRSATVTARAFVIVQGTDTLLVRQLGTIEGAAFHPAALEVP